MHYINNLPIPVTGEEFDAYLTLTRARIREAKASLNASALTLALFEKNEASAPEEIRKVAAKARQQVAECHDLIDFLTGAVEIFEANRPAATK